MLLGSTLLMAGTGALADTVNPANMTTFSAGTPAVAAEVNANFDEQTTQINDNSSRIDALSAGQTSYVSGLIADSSNTGPVNGRVLVINKSSDTSELRITYTDNFRAYSGGGVAACSWEIQIDGVSCASESLVYSFYSAGTNVNLHRSSTVVGYCHGLPAGLHTLSVSVSPHVSYPASDCYTGWESSFMLEVEEVN